MIKRRLFQFWIITVLLIITAVEINGQVKICPSNPHYFFYKERPIVLITSDHH